MRSKHVRRLSRPSSHTPAWAALRRATWLPLSEWRTASLIKYIYWEVSCQWPTGTSVQLCLGQEIPKDSSHCVNVQWAYFMGNTTLEGKKKSQLCFYIPKQSSNNPPCKWISLLAMTTEVTHLFLFYWWPMRSLSTQHLTQYIFSSFQQALSHSDAGALSPQ